MEVSVIHAKLVQKTGCDINSNRMAAASPVSTSSHSLQHISSHLAMLSDGFHQEHRENEAPASAAKRPRLDEQANAQHVDSEEETEDGSELEDSVQAANRQYHKNTEASSTLSGPLHCTWPDCGRVFPKPTRLREHMFSHTGEVFAIENIISQMLATFFLQAPGMRQGVCEKSSSACTREITLGSERLHVLFLHNVSLIFKLYAPRLWQGIHQ